MLILKNILNSKIFLYCIIGFVIWFWIKDRQSLKQDVERLSNNQIALTLQHSRELEVTKNEFKRLFHKEDSIAQLVGIKPSQVQQVIVNNYHYKDSTVVNVPYQDSTKTDTMKFIAPLGCMKVEGYVTKKGVTFTNEEFNDKFHTFLYKINNKRISFRNKDKINYDHSFLFLKWNKHFDVKTYSECKQDTVSVETNIKVINN